MYASKHTKSTSPGQDASVLFFKFIEVTPGLTPLQQSSLVDMEKTKKKQWHNN
jgi:hypothetical protein